MKTYQDSLMNAKLFKVKKPFIIHIMIFVFFGYKNASNDNNMKLIGFLGLCHEYSFADNTFQNITSLMTHHSLVLNGMTIFMFRFD